MSTSTSNAAWLQASLAALYKPNDSDFESNFDRTFAADAEITANHAPIARDAFKEDMRSRGFAATSVDVSYKDVIEAPVADGQQATEVSTSRSSKWTGSLTCVVFLSPQSGIVAGFVSVTRSLRFRIRAAPAQTTANIIFSAKCVAIITTSASAIAFLTIVLCRIGRDSTPPADGSQDDGRRIVQFFQTSVDKAAPIHLQSVA